MQTMSIISLRACETLWSAREIVSVALSAERERHTDNMFHIVLNKYSHTVLEITLNFQHLTAPFI